MKFTLVIDYKEKYFWRLIKIILILKAFAPSIAEEFTRPRRKPIQTTRKVSLLF